MSMKKFLSFAVAGLMAGGLFAQQPQRQATATVAQMTEAHSYAPRILQLNQSLHDNSMLRANQTGTPTLSPRGKVAAVNPIGIGEATNVFTILRPEQNQVMATDSLGLVTFIHRHNTNVWGGSSGNLRYDYSIDAGQTFTSDVGEINPAITRPARYPNMTQFNNSGTSNPLDAKVVYSAPTLNPSPDWDGHVTGIWDISATPTGTENYALLSSNTYLQGGLCQGRDGEFWSVEFQYNGSAILGDLYVNKGVYNSTTQDVDWEREDTLVPNHYTGFDGTASIIGPNIEFSPDGETGWIAFLGDLVGGQDSVWSPTFIKSVDGGESWDVAGATQVDLNSLAGWVADSLQSLWVDSSGNPASSGLATCAFDFDLTVDQNGNPHLFAVIGSGSTPAAPEPGYTIYSGLAKFVADIWSPDGGATWRIRYISPVLTFRTQDFGTTTTVNMDNFPQISRTPDGSRIFYSWADSDTAQFTGSMNGVGFGEVTNLAPNLRVAALNTSTGRQYYPQLVSDGDLIWEGRILYPTMAPEVLFDATNGNWHLPIVMAEMTTNDPLDVTKFWYFGNDALISNDPNRWHAFNTMCLGWDQFAVPGFNDAVACLVGAEDAVESGIVLHQSFPNPTTDQALIRFELPAVTDLTLNVVNLYGQEVAVLGSGEFAAGQHEFLVNTENMAAGVYFYNLQAGDHVITKKMIVTK